MEVVGRSTSSMMSLTLSFPQDEILAEESAQGHEGSQKARADLEVLMG